MCILKFMREMALYCDIFLEAMSDHLQIKYPSAASLTWSLLAVY